MPDVANSLSPSRKLRILIIDDDPIVLQVARERLEAAGYTVATREHAVGTVQQVRDEQPDVVLLDIMMPALNGERLATLLKSWPKTADVAIILYSSKPHAELTQLVNDTGAIGCISKSEHGDDFVRQFESLARKSFPNLRAVRA